MANNWIKKPTVGLPKKKLEVMPLSKAVKAPGKMGNQAKVVEKAIKKSKPEMEY